MMSLKAREDQSARNRDNSGVIVQNPCFATARFRHNLGIPSWPAQGSDNRSSEQSGWTKLSSSLAPCRGRTSRPIGTPTDSKSRKRRGRTDCASASMRVKSRCCGSSPSPFLHRTTCCISCTRHDVETSLDAIKALLSIFRPLTVSWRSFGNF